MKLEQLKAQRAIKVAAMQSTLDLATAENREMTAEEVTNYDTLMAEQTTLKSGIERAEAQEKLNIEMATPVSAPIHAPAIITSGENQVLEETGFSSFGEFLGAVKTGTDSRLDFKSQSMGTGSDGGFLVPKQFGEMLTAFKPSESIVRSRATVIPAGQFPDAAISFPALDQSGSLGVYSGVTTSWTGEGEEIDETNFKLREIELKTNPLAAFIPFSNKLLRNTAVASTMGQMLLRQAIAKAEDDAFINGDGIAKPLGFIGHNSTIAINRATANKVAYADLVGMLAVAKGDNLEWTLNRTVIHQLMNLVDGLGQLIWQVNAVVGQPTTLLGYPVKFVERTPVLGTKGDVVLADLSYYYVKDGSDIIISMSEHVQFTKDKTLIKAVYNVDGQPSINDKLTLEDGTNQVSPFVVLDIPSA